MEEKITKVLLSLIDSVITDEQTDITEYFSLSIDERRRVWDLAQKHSILPIIGEALVEYNSKNKIAIDEQLKSMMMLSVYTHEKLQIEIDNVVRVLEEGKIPYIKLKGARVRQYYPQPWFRTSCDIDILIHEEDVDSAVELLIQRLGYRKEKRDYHDILLFAPNDTCLELHFSINENTENLDHVLKKVWENSFPVASEKNSTEFKQSNEFFLFHLLAHMSYHFMHGGCGIRSVIDIYLIRRDMQYDENKLREFCKEAQIETFYDYIVQLSKVWFEHDPHNEVTRSMGNFILRGGTYGIQKNTMAIQHNKKGGHFKYICSRLFVSYEHLQGQYPILQKYKWLTPFYQLVRWGSIITEKKWNQCLTEYEVSKNVSDIEVKNTERLLEMLKLN